MTLKSMRLLFVCVTLLALSGLIAACGGGGTDNDTPDVGEDFSLIVSATPSSGAAPLTVTFFVTASNGVGPYTYAWDFDGDGVTDNTSNSGTYIYTADGVATVVVTDAEGKIVTGKRSITITSTGGTVNNDELDVRFTATPMVGNVPFECQFKAFVTGGKEPYSYSWDFEGDGTPDAFLEDPLYVFEEVGDQVDTTAYVYYPILTVTDNRGVKATNLDDKDGNSQPDYRLAINALPPSALTITAIANPLTGQAPLNVEFTGAAAGGSGEYEYKWSFGDGQASSYSASSITSHTYLADGTYLAVCTVHDTVTNQTVSSAPLTVVAAVTQQFEIEISADLNEGQVPFLVNMEATVSNGKEPIRYEWDVFDDNPADPEPDLFFPPTLDANAVVTPDFTYRKNPTIHFGNTARVNGTKQYIVRCVAEDDTGNIAISNLVRVSATGTYPPNGTPYYYEAERPDVVAATTWDPMGGTAHPLFTPVSAEWSPRANAAVCSHPTGITWIIGGEKLDENGNLEDLVDRGDSVFMYVPRAAATGTAAGSIGKFNINGESIGGVNIPGVGQLTGDTAVPGLAGGLVLLNDTYGPAFPGSSGDGCLQQYGGGSTLRSSQFTIVGSAAAIFCHELPEANADGSYQSARNTFPDGGPDMIPVYPDSPNASWNVDDAMMNRTGLGVPIIYVFGGRDAQGQPTNLVQKYYPYGFGTEDMPLESADWMNFQTTNNQTNIWSNYFTHADTDHNPTPETLPEVTSIPSAPLPTLPVATYGLTAVTVETGVQAAAPSYPNGPFRNAYLFGGINENGQVLNTCYSWNLNESPEQTGGEESVFVEMATMPTPRAYGKALFLPYTFQIAIVGGHDQNGVALNTIDILNLDNPFNPVGGAWDSFEGTLPEALEACGAGYLDNGESATSWIMTFGGWNESTFSSAMYEARLRSSGNIVLKTPVPVVPRRNAGSSQSGSRILGVSFNRFYVVAGVDENGSDSIIEVVSLP